MSYIRAYVILCVYDHICIEFLQKHAKMKQTPPYVKKIT